MTKVRASSRDRCVSPAVVVLSIATGLLLCGALIGFGYLLWSQHRAGELARQAESEALPIVEQTFQPEAALPENPVDFEALQQENPDAYAWLCIPGTNVNLPVFQRAGDDFFYLNHDRYGNAAVEGAVFSQSANAKDFSDPVTVLYGHNILNEAMFSTLHRFEDPGFFDGNDQLYVYLPDRILTYRVVAAYEYDDRHILNSFDFSDPTVVQSYFDSVLAPQDPNANVRAGVQLNADSRIVQLSTCRSALTEDPVRYIVTGVLMEEQPTA